MGDKLALLYNVAGYSLEQLVISDYVSLGPLETGVRAVAFKLLSEFNKNVTVSHEVPLGKSVPRLARLASRHCGRLTII